MFTCGPTLMGGGSGAGPGVTGLQFVGSTTTSNTLNGSTYAVSLTGLTGGIASAPAENDIVIVMTGWGRSGDEVPAVSTSGYTNAHVDLYANDGRDPNMVTAYKVMGATPDTSVTVNTQASSGGANATVVHVWRGVDTTTPMDVTAATAVSINSNNANSPLITPVTGGAVILACGLASTGALTVSTSAPSGMENFASVSGIGVSYGVLAGIASIAWSGSGSYDPAAWVCDSDSTSNAWAASTLVLRPAP